MPGRYVGRLKLIRSCTSNVTEKLKNYFKKEIKKKTSNVAFLREASLQLPASVVAPALSSPSSWDVSMAPAPGLWEKAVGRGRRRLRGCRGDRARARAGGAGRGPGVPICELAPASARAWHPAGVNDCCRGWGTCTSEAPRKTALPQTPRFRSRASSGQTLSPSGAFGTRPALAEESH